MRAFRIIAIVGLVLAAVGATASRTAAGTTRITPVVGGLGFAVNLAPLPDGRILVADKTGRILVIEDGELRPAPLATLPVDATNNETGLLGLAVDPAFPEQPWVYAYLSDVRDGMNRLVRMRLEDDGVGEPETLFDAIATTPIHNGGDLAFGNDETLFLVTGDGAESSSSQDPNDPRGKVLRFERDGSIPEDNPTPGSPVYALGVRNSFGLCVDQLSGDLWETENGPTSWDEVNQVRPADNLGWPEHLGPGGAPRFVDPVLAFEEVIVPTGCVASNGQLTFGDYGGRLHRMAIPGFAGGEGRPADAIVAELPDGITDVAFGPGMGPMYVLTTSTLYRVGAGGSPSGPTGEDTGGASATTATAAGDPTATPPSSGGDDGFGTALGTTGGLVVLALLAAGFLWLRSRALRR